MNEGLTVLNGLPDQDTSWLDDSEPGPFESRTDPRGTEQRLREGLIGWKLALRHDSSYFAHGYRALLIAVPALLLGVDLAGWCMLLLSFGLVLVAEAVRTVASYWEVASMRYAPDLARHAAEARRVASGAVLTAVLIASVVAALVLGSYVMPYL